MTQVNSYQGFSPGHGMKRRVKMRRRKRRLREREISPGHVSPMHGLQKLSSHQISFK